MFSQFTYISNKTITYSLAFPCIHFKPYVMEVLHSFDYRTYKDVKQDAASCIGIIGKCMGYNYGKYVYLRFVTIVTYFHRITQYLCAEGNAFCMS